MRLAISTLGALAAILLSGCDPTVAQKEQWQPLDLGPQELEMTFARLIPDTNQLSILKGSDYIHSNELALLSEFGLRGRLVARGYYRRGEGKRARVLVVLTTNVSSPVELLQPNATNGVYVQTPKGFVLLPSDTPTIAKTLRLERYAAPVDRDTTFWSIKMGSVIQGGTAWIWTEQAD